MFDGWIEFVCIQTFFSDSFTRDKNRLCHKNELRIDWSVAPCDSQVIDDVNNFVSLIISKIWSSTPIRSMRFLVYWLFLVPFGQALSHVFCIAIALQPNEWNITTLHSLIADVVAASDNNIQSEIKRVWRNKKKLVSYFHAQCSMFWRGFHHCLHEMILIARRKFLLKSID